MFRSRALGLAPGRHLRLQQHVLGRLERARARRGRATTSAARRPGARCSPCSASARCSAASPRCGSTPAPPLCCSPPAASVLRHPARLPGGRRAAAGARAQRVARRRLADARQRRLGDDAAAPHPVRPALARERVRLVRLARLPADRARDVGPDRRADRHLDRAVDRRRPCKSPCVAVLLAVPDIRHLPAFPASPLAGKGKAVDRTTHSALPCGRCAARGRLLSAIAPVPRERPGGRHQARRPQPPRGHDPALVRAHAGPHLRPGHAQEGPPLPARATG